MDASVVNLSMNAVVREMRERLEEAAASAKAAEAYAHAGRPDKGVEAASDIDDLVYEVEKLIGASTTIIRLRQSREPGAEDGHGPVTESHRAPPIDAALSLATLNAFLIQARERLDRAVGIARSAEICTETGQADEAVRISLDIEPLLYEVKNFINTASIVNRMSKA